ncbi:AAEL002550-PC [Aedes aegypti]|uniref:Ataxin-2 C-terminal domain-containing protein n=2 Tax=Aedes aegypti TaxID=7159 RepID=A0A8W7H6U7_AEDAE|nr:polyadenylate-binding protein-interacting protein 2 [Aedes aegypti]XP_001655604.1 polyadenylate-binding protein-interacting protein 2 [Aedes aegypti]XP_021713412.1 polyadenylate-binding protein-interacting protein 2 [Aedes aegypti]EAT46241.1 AAEL002550-PA [Aedes aegypti]EAT46242.1 AAEL002550-PD [Aedes aegypti]EAT46243.1 AAEL002550-PB [Aedes aegypti]EAT46244.1 AAEL002550-PC [Aedes aegypti]
MKMPDHSIGCSSSNNGYSGNYSDSYDSDPDGYITPPNEDNSNGGGPNLDEDFSEYMWMENEEEFDKQEMQRLEEEALMEQCIEAMLQDELDAVQDTNRDPTLAVDSPKDLCYALSSLQVQSNDPKVAVEQSTLNPLAAEFVPSVLSSTSV